MRIVPAAVSVGLLCAVTAACGSNSETVSDAVHGHRSEQPVLAVWGPDGAPKPAAWVIAQ